MEYYILAFVSLIITLIAQGLISSSYGKYNKIQNKKGLSGLDVAQTLLKEYDLENIYVIETKGYLSDHYDPNAKVIRLSSSVFHDSSIASLAVAAHEVGHAIQYKEGNKFIKIRSLIFPVVNLCSKLGYVVIIISFLTGILNLLYLGIVMLGVILIFHLLTLPVEFNASKKAVDNLQKYDLITSDEVSSVSSMLRAAAFTYVASLATTIIEILRLVIISRDR